MTALADLRAAITEAVRAVPGVGVVHDRNRYVADAAQFVALFRDREGVLRAWIVSLGTSARPEPAVGLFGVLRVFTVRGYLAVNDAADSEATFLDLADAVAGALARLTPAGTLNLGPVRWTYDALVEFAGVVCHRATVEVPVEMDEEV